MESPGAAMHHSVSQLVTLAVERSHHQLVLGAGGQVGDEVTLLSLIEDVVHVSHVAGVKGEVAAIRSPPGDCVPGDAIFTSWTD